MYDDYESYNNVQNTQIAPVRRKRNRGSGGTAVLIILFLFASVASGFAGGYAANIMRPAPEAIILPAPISPLEEMSLPEEISPQEEVNPPSDESTVFAETNMPETDAAEDTGTETAAVMLPVAKAEVVSQIRESVVEIKTETAPTGFWFISRGGVGAGSGVIVSEEGYIVTNNHVISGVTNITVRLSDGREFPAELISTDARTDLAVIKISAENLTSAVFGDSDGLLVGDGALAVGNPLGELGGTVTSGIISALDRDIVLDGQITTLLQTDAAVNPGNSGGGLFNLNGELIGVVVAKSSGTNIEGLGFAVPSNTAGKVISDLMEHGFVRGRASVGLELLDIQTAQVARMYRVSEAGVYILESDDERLNRGDRIITVGRWEITSQISFDAVMRNFKVGDTVSITVMRGNQTVTADMTATEWRP